jgi:glycosyltransferase involved in cell wall biosynthesis
MIGDTSPETSVISIFYNADAFFVEAIESVLAQSDQDFELLLVDDGSTDGSTAIARDYARRYPGRIFYLEHAGHANKGMSATRNLGIAHARGEFIAFIDSDDVWLPNKLADQVAIMRRHAELGAVCGAVNYWRSWCGGEDVMVPTGHCQDRPVDPPDASLKLYPLGEAAAPCPSDLMLRRDVVEKLGGFEEHFTGPRQMYEDQGFLAKLYLEAPVYFSRKNWLNYRQHDQSCMAQVASAGRYKEVRYYFLKWFEHYLEQSDRDKSGAVKRACAKALWPYRHPVLSSILTRVGKVAPNRLAGSLR